MGSSGSSAPTETTTTTEPADYIKPYLEQSANASQALYQNGGGYSYFPNSTVVGFDDATNQSLALTEQRAMNGSPLTSGAQNLAQSTLNGDYLNSNPYLDTAIDTASRGLVRNYTDAVKPSIDSNFASSGRYGSGMYANAQDAAQENLAQGLGDVASGMTYQNYSAERDNQNQMAALAPSLAEQDYNDYTKLAAVGGAREAQSQALLQEDIDRYNYENNGERMALDDYISRLNGAGGTYGTQTATGAGGTSGGSAFAGALGGAATGAGLVGGLGTAGLLTAGSPIGWGIMGASALAGAFS